jgi:PiT family inorganic phosphate transporter
MTDQPAPTGISQTISRDPLNLFFGLLLLVSTIVFLMWGLEYTNHNQVLIFILASFFGLFMAFNIGGNDVANSFGTSVGAGTLSMKQALIVAAIFEVSGAVIAGGEVTKTIRGDIVNLSSLSIAPMQFGYIMMSSLLSAALWLLFASKKGYPVSTTHSIIGGIVGASISAGLILGGGEESLALVKWDKIGTIALSWVISPVLGGLLSYLFFSFVKKSVLDYNERIALELAAIKEEKRVLKDKNEAFFEQLDEKSKVTHAKAISSDLDAYAEEDNDEEMDGREIESAYVKELQSLRIKKRSLNANKALENFVPLIAAIATIIITAMLLLKGLSKLDINLSLVDTCLLLGMLAAIAWIVTLALTRTLRGKNVRKSTFFVFSWMQVFTACAFAFSHGSNDIANAMGPFAAIMDVIRTGAMGGEVPIPSLAMVSFGIALVAGLWFIGREVILTVGHHLTEMHPASGFCAELAAAGVVLMASLLGIPVSSTHILIGAVLGIGIVNSNSNWSLMRPIGLAWVITLPAAGILSGIVFWILNSFLIY